MLFAHNYSVKASSCYPTKAAFLSMNEPWLKMLFFRCIVVNLKNYV